MGILTTGRGDTHTWWTHTHKKMEDVRKEKERQEQEECLREIELLQLQEKRMKALVAQRREERREMDLENSRMERQLKFMKEMVKENEEADEVWEAEQRSKQPFSGTGNILGAPSGGGAGERGEPGHGAKSAAATAAAARLFSGYSTSSLGAPTDRPEPGAAGCTGQIGKEERGLGSHREAVRTLGPGHVLGIDEAQWGGERKNGTSAQQVPPPSAGPAPKPVNVDSSKPTGNIQVRLGDGGRIVVTLNTFHTVAHIRQQVRSKQPQETRDFDLVTLGPPPKVLEDDLVLQEGNLIGSAVMQRFL